MEAGKPEAIYTNLNGIRIATSNEPSDGQKMNDSLIKIIGSKEGIQYRTLYSNVIETLNIQFVLNIFCNNKIEYNGNDGGMQRRLKVIDYNSKFITKDKYTINGEKNNPSSPISNQSGSRQPISNQSGSRQPISNQLCSR